MARDRAEALRRFRENQPGANVTSDAQNANRRMPVKRTIRNFSDWYVTAPVAHVSLFRIALSARAAWFLLSQ